LPPDLRIIPVNLVTLTDRPENRHLGITLSHPSGASIMIIATTLLLKRFRNYFGLIKVAKSGFPWEKTTTGDVASIYTNCETAISAVSP
jgi:hypothetical protein